MQAALIERLLTQQHELTAVERFSQKHAETDSPALARYYRDLIPLSQPGPGEQYAFEVDLDACTGCKACVAACHSLNGLDEGESWRDVGLLLGEFQGQPFQQHVTTACHHCVDPACANGCPVLAYEKDEATGIVRHLDDQCIGCSYCILKCPYDVPKYSESRGIVRKCDMCHGRLGQGEAPACVQSCPNEAIRIRVVKQEDIAARSQSGHRLVATAFDSSYTQPTTQFLGTGASEQVENARSRKSTRLIPEPAHLPLVWMLTLTQISVGWLGAALMHGNRAAALASIVAGMLGLIASILHLGRPLLAWKAFLGFRKSWLSREIIAFGAWMPMTLLFGGLTWFQHPLATPAGILALMLGLAAVACSAMVYVDTHRDFWRAERTFPLFFGTTLVSWAALHAVLGGTAWLVVNLLLLLGAEFHASLSGASRSTLMMKRPLKQVTIARAGFPLAGLLLLSMDAGLLGVALILLGELMGRVLYFQAVTAPRIAA